MSIDEKEYEERADDIEYADLEKWTVKSEFFNRIYKKIIQRGAKLIVGPRGTGKTHQMKFAYYKCLRDKKLSLAIYVSFNKYYYLEPFLHKAPNAIKIFHTWVLSKILLSCYQFLSDIKESAENLFDDESLLERKNLEILVSQLEKSEFDDRHDELISKVTIRRVIKTIENLEIKFGRSRTILLLDDAALNFTPDYMVEFFDIFRSLKAVNIAPKASVYPGTTEYGPRFHVSQDAELVQCWLNIEDEEYSQFMSGLVNKRLSEDGELPVPEDITELLKYASFGVPRRFIGMIRSFIESKGATPHQRFNKVINEQKQFITDEYLSLSRKLPQYRDIIKTGFNLYDQIIDTIVKENKKNRNTKQITIGLEEDKNVKLNRMVKFLIEAGLLYMKDIFLTCCFLYLKEHLAKEPVLMRRR